MNNPVLVEVLRGEAVESRHAGAVAAVDAVLVESGYQPPQWYRRLKRIGEARVGTSAALVTRAARAGLRNATATEAAVSLAGLAAEALVDWRLGMAHVAPFVAALDPARREALRARCREAVSAAGPAAPAPILVLVAQV